MNRRVLLAGLILVVPLLLFLFLGLGKNPGEIRSPLIGRVAPSFALKPVGSKATVSLDSLRGRPVVLNFWATWCVPCYAEHGVLLSGAREFQPSVQFLGVVYEDEEANITQFLQEKGGAYPNLMDDQARTAIAYGVHGVPETFFLDRNGRIMSRHVGPLTEESLRENLRKVTGS